jgi:hypothetical protein
MKNTKYDAYGNIKIAYRTLNPSEFNAVYGYLKSKGYDFGTPAPSKFVYRPGYNRLSVWEDGTLCYGVGNSEILYMFNKYYEKLYERIHKNL